MLKHRTPFHLETGFVYYGVFYLGGNGKWLCFIVYHFQDTKLCSLS